MLILQPARPWYPGFSHALVGTGSTPNLAAGSYSLPPRTLSSVVLGDDTQRLSFNTIAHSASGFQRPEHHQISDGAVFGSSTNLPRDAASHGTYSTYQPPAPPLGYIVAYTPEQLTEIIKDQYHFGPPSSMYQSPAAGHHSPSASPKKTIPGRHSLLVGNEVRWLLYI